MEYSEGAFQDECLPDTFERHLSLPQSSSSSRFLKAPLHRRTGLFSPLEIGLSPQFALLLQNSAPKPTRERLQHDGDKKGQDQISSDRKAKAQSSISVLLQW
jgi:hypothetical protein